jgi:thiol:disulfide interchange protein/DsbC/DsbD-like thiol-disulfide interchange protein
MRIGATLGVVVGLVLASLVLVPAALGAPPAAGDLVKPALYAETATVAPGHTLWLDLHLAIAPGWHIYWRNPGDSGLPTAIAWTLPPGFTAGDISWPVPERFVVGSIGNYGYAGGADLLVPVTAPATLEHEPAHLGAKVDYLACSEICVPGSATLALDLPDGPGAPDPAQADRFAAARRALPVEAPFAARFAAEQGDLRLIVPAAAVAGLRSPKAIFFPDAENAIDASAAPKIEQRGGGLDLVMAKSGSPVAAVPATLDGILALQGSDGTTHGYLLSAARIASPPADGGGPVGWWQALVFAFVGGMILNLMPCVFPVLSLKLLGFAGMADPATRRHHGSAYAAGVVASFAALGAALLALRAGGAAIGWGFQLQSPIVVALLAYLMLAMGLSLSGVAEFGIGWIGAGGRLAERGGVVGAFFTGVLATVVATPCVAPFMGAALGAALVAPALLALAIFLALGAGLAAPLLAASFVPGIARILPRPGGWMATLKQILAFPLYATAAWLVWVLTQEVGPEGSLAVLFGLVLVGFAVWVYGRSRLAGTASRRAGSVLAGIGLSAAMVLAAMLSPAAGHAPPASDGLAYEPFTPARLAALNAEHQAVFVNLTAAWCLTCIVNERATLDRDAVRQAFAAHKIVALKGDWTRQDPEIARFLQSFGRSGVPLYLLYDGNGSATVLPQILTEDEVIEAVGKL